MTTTEYHNKFFPGDISWKQFACRTVAISRLEGVFGCPKQPSASELVEALIVKVLAYKVLTYYVLLGKDKNECWHELAISREKDLIALWRDVHYGSVVAKTVEL